MFSARRGGAWRRAALGALTTLAVLAGVAVTAPPAGAEVRYATTPVAGWSTNGTVRAVAVVGDTVYVGGSFTELRGPGGTPAVRRVNLAAIDRETGAVRADFRADTNGVVRSLVGDGGALYVGGSFTTLGGASRSRLAKLDLVTGARLPWSASVTSHVYALAVSGDRVYVGGAFGTANGVARSRLAAFDAASGALRADFAPAADATVHAIAVAPGGDRVYVGGNFRAIGGVSRSYLAALGADGALLPTTFQHLSASILDLDVAPDGATVFAAQGGYGNQATAYDATTGRRLWLQRADGDVQAVRYASGTVYFGFHESFGGDTTVRLLAADARSGALDPAFRPAVDGYWGVWDIAASRDALAVGGEFLQVSGVATRGVAVLPNTAGVDTTAPTEPVGLVAEPAGTVVTLRWSASSDDQHVEGYRVLRDGATVGFAIDPVFVDRSVAGEQAYRYTVVAVDAAGNASTPSDALEVRTPRPLVRPGSSWRYLALATPPAEWVSPSFDDAAWAVGPMQLGYGDGDEATIVPSGPDPANRPITTWFRTTFTVDDPLAVRALAARLVVDDGALVRLNGQEVHRFNLPTGTVLPTTRALVALGGADESTVRAVEMDPAALVAGLNVLTVEVHNADPSSSDLSFALELDAVIGEAPPPPEDLTPPSVPEGVEAVVTGPGAVRVSWLASTDAGGPVVYEVYRSVDGALAELIATTAGLSHDDVGLAPGSLLTYAVVAIDAAGNASAPSAPAAVDLPVPGDDVTPPSAPAGLTATPAGSTSVGLVWQPSTDDVGVVGYEVRRDGVVLGTLGGLTYTATGLTPSTTYSVEVVALDAAGNRSAASSVLVTTAPAVTPVVTASTSWRFLDTGADPGASWTTVGFDDSAWRTGLGQFGYGDGDEVTVVGFGPDASRKHLVTWFRSTFTVEDPATVQSLTLQLLRDDGAAVHLNGVEVHRSNLPAGPLSATTRALTNIDGSAERVWHAVTLPASALVPGVNVLAVSVHQQWASSSDLSFDLRLDLNR